jgi:hypothetical protein
VMGSAEEEDGVRAGKDLVVVCHLGGGSCLGKGKCLCRGQRHDTTELDRRREGLEKVR